MIPDVVHRADDLGRQGLQRDHHDYENQSQDQPIFDERPTFLIARELPNPAHTRPLSISTFPIPDYSFCLKESLADG